MARITGNDGNFALATFNLVANSWSMTVTPTVTDVTGFGDSHKIAVTGMATFSGSASGFLETDAAPGIEADNLEGQSGVVVTLTAASGCHWTGTAIMTNCAINANKNGDTTISWDFQFISAVDILWDD